LPFDIRPAGVSRATSFSGTARGIIEINSGGVDIDEFQGPFSTTHMGTGLFRRAAGKIHGVPLSVTPVRT
jgi:hypothetical protein